MNKRWPPLCNGRKEGKKEEQIPSSPLTPICKWGYNNKLHACYHTFKTEITNFVLTILPEEYMYNLKLQENKKLHLYSAYIKSCTC